MDIFTSHELTNLKLTGILAQLSGAKHAALPLADAVGHDDALFAVNVRLGRHNLLAAGPSAEVHIQDGQALAGQQVHPGAQVDGLLHQAEDEARVARAADGADQHVAGVREAVLGAPGGPAGPEHPDAGGGGGVVPAAAAAAGELEAGGQHGEFRRRLLLLLELVLLHQARPPVAVNPAVVHAEIVDARHVRRPARERVPEGDRQVLQRRAQAHDAAGGRHQGHPAPVGPVERGQPLPRPAAQVVPHALQRHAVRARARAAAAGGGGLVQEKNGGMLAPDLRAREPRRRQNGVPGAAHAPRQAARLESREEAEYLGPNLVRQVFLAEQS